MSDKWQAGHDLMVSMMGRQFAAAVEGEARAGNFGSPVGHVPQGPMTAGRRMLSDR